MTRLLATFLVMLAALGPAAGWTAAQSLADVARKEEERRKQVKTSGKVYTNKDVKPASPAPPPPADAGEQPPSAGSPAPGGSAAAEPPSGGEKPAVPEGERPAEADEAEKRAADETEWREKMAAARRQLERSRMFAEALQSRINGLYADFVARDDPAQRAVIEADRKKALAELERVKADVQVHTKAIADLEEEARRAGVPPGWLR